MKPAKWNWEIYKGETVVKTFTLSKNDENGDPKPFPSGEGVGVRSQLRTAEGELFASFTSEESGGWTVSTGAEKHTFILTIPADVTSTYTAQTGIKFSIEVFDGTGFVCIPYQGRVKIYEEITIEESP